MKGLVIFMISVMILTSSCSSGTNGDASSEPNSNINSYYTVADSQEDIASVFFLGYGQDVDEKKLDEIISKYNIKLTAKDIKTVGESGDEWYLILPKFKDSAIKIYNAELGENGLLKKTDEICTASEPIILKCNVSDIIPSVIISLTANDRTVEFSPFISLKDGTIQDIENIYTE